MSNEQVTELYETLKENIEILEESTSIETQINGILGLLKSNFELMEAADGISFLHSDSIRTLEKALEPNLKIITEHEERINKLLDITEKIASTSTQLAEQTKSSVENTAKNIDTLVEKINEQANEIYENAAAIKEIKDSLKL